MNCFQLLGLPDHPTPSPEEVKRAWRLAASKHHPDNGGDAAEFNRLRLAYEEAMEEAERPKVCSSCGGNGRILHANGWGGINLLCERCDGSGVEP